MQLPASRIPRAVLLCCVIAWLDVGWCAGDDCNGDGIPDDQLGQGRLFLDVFSWTTIDQNKWDVIWAPTIDELGLNEPSGIYSLHLDGHPYGGDTIESVPIDLSTATSLVLTYYWQRTGGGESPEVNDDLIVEFADADGFWIELARYLGNGDDMTEYALESITLPAAAYHADFVLRFRNIATAGRFDDWFVDDIFITDGVVDCNANGIPDDCDIDDGTSLDCNVNGIPDLCDIYEGICADCNANGVPDECDIALGTSLDENGDLVPDECQDCNNNGVLDPADISHGVSADCNSNGIPDECELADGSSDDCNANGVPDECDIAPWTYRVDDDTLEAKIGAGNGGGFIWLNQFVVQAEAEYVDTIEIAWGLVAEGTPTTLAIWSDPDDDGDPSNAELVLTAGPVPVENPSTNIFTSVSVPRTYLGQPGEIFFVGAHASHLVGEFPAAIDITPPSLERGWVAFGDEIEFLWENPIPPALVDTYRPGNLLVRCRSTFEDCNGNDALDECDIADEYSYDNNYSNVPDECELGSGIDLELAPDAPCYTVGDNITIEIWMHNAEVEIVGGQFFLEYDQARLELVDIVPAGAPAPFTEEIYECSPIAGGGNSQCLPAPGLIDYAVGIVPDTTGATGSSPMAVMTFNALEAICSADDLLTWRVDEVVRLGTVLNTPDYPLLTQVVVGDDVAPMLIVPPGQVAEIETSGVCSAELDVGNAEATDSCTDEGDLLVTWQRSDGAANLADPFNIADSPIVITWTAEDVCGNMSTDETAITVLLLGDLDYDADVDLSDLAQMLSNYGTTSGATYEQGDLDGDGDIELSDLAALLSVYGTDCN